MWIVIPCLREGRDQLDHRFPSRDKSSEGTIGDTAHQTSPSSHNPDLTGSPEYQDGDALDEVRAWDADKDLNDPQITMERVVELWISKARSGSMPWLRYLIYNRRIWHKRDGFVSHLYTGSNPHTDHVHVNSDFTSYADEVTNTNWHLEELNGPPASIPVITSSIPGPPIPFPLPDRYYFGYAFLDIGESVSGKYNRIFKGRPDREWLKGWVVQLIRRGWSIGVTKTYLTKYGNDGRFGIEYDRLVRAFQEDQHLIVDGKLGINTWNAAYHNLIS